MITMRVKMDEYGNIVRGIIDSTVASVQKGYKSTNVQQLFWTYLDLGKAKTVTLLELGQSNMATYLDLGKVKALETYAFLLTASGIYHFYRAMFNYLFYS